MTHRPEPVTDSELHAYVDGQLDLTRRAEVEAYLSEHPDAQARVQEYQVLNQALHSLYDPALKEPIPSKLVRAASPRRWPGMAMRAAVAAGWMAFGGVIVGFLMHESGVGERPSVVAAHLVRPAAFAHAVYVPEVLHPVEVPGDQEAHLVKWLSKRLHTQLRAPNLLGLGYELVGGRLLPSSDRMAAQFMYQDNEGNRVTLYIRRGAWENTETAFRYARERNVGVFYWIDGPMGYALVGELNKQELLRLAQAVVR